MEKEIIVENKEEFFNKIIANYKPLGSGAEGTAYQMGSNVIKILNGYDNRKHSKDEYLQFSDIKSKYFYFTKKVYLCDGQVISVVGNTCPGKNLLQIDPLKININKFIKNYTDLKEEAINLTNKNIFFFDVQFNCMYSPNKMGIIDTSDFAFTDRNPNQLLIDNLSIIQTCYLDFIIKGYFEYFIEHTPLLKKMYKEIENKNINIYEEFLFNFKKIIEEIEDKEITYLREAQKVIKKTNTYYPRNII